MADYIRDLLPTKWGSGVSLHGSIPEALMSALGQKQTFGPRKSMSALPPKADIGTHSWNVCFVPKANRTRPPVVAVIQVLMKISRCQGNGWGNIAKRAEMACGALA